MASLSNINGLFDVHSTGAILFSTSHGTSGQILRSNGDAAPTWVAASTVIGGPYLPLTGGTLSGPLSGTSANFSGIVYSSGGFRTGSTNSSYNLLTRDNNNGSYPLYCQNSLGVSGDAAIARFAYGSYGANTGTVILDIRSGTSYFNDCNLGIGTDSPNSYYTNANNLVVGTHTGSNGISILSATNQTGWLVFADSTAGGDNTRGAIAYNHDDNSMTLRVNNNPAIKIDSDRNVGIRTTTVQANTSLDVRGNGTTSDAAIKAYAYGGSGTSIVGNGYATSGSGTNYGVRGISTGPRSTVAGSVNVGGYFSASNAETNYALITGTGNVGIGTATPETPLHVLSNTTDNASTMLIQNGSTGDASIKFNISGDTYSIGIDNSDGDKFKLSYGAVGTNDRIVVDSSGNVGIGTPNPSKKLSVNGGIVAGNNNTDAGASQIYGDIRRPQATNFSKRNYILTASAGDALYSIARQWHDTANWGLGNINVIMWGIYYGRSNFSKADFSCRYGYSGNVADVEVNFNPGGLGTPSWTAATQVSGNIYYRDLQILIPAYTQISFEIISPGCAQTYNINNTANNTVYLYPH